MLATIRCCHCFVFFSKKNLHSTIEYIINDGVQQQCHSCLLALPLVRIGVSLSHQMKQPIAMKWTHTQTHTLVLDTHPFKESMTLVVECTISLVINSTISRYMLHSLSPLSLSFALYSILVLSRCIIKTN